ncbi:MAG: glycosyltransferase [Tepidisphaeraceae bacterium]|jgi:putative colanic acid biosynthesis acetyltransferase WcaF
MVDVLIQTHNEELNLPHTLASVKGWVNRIFVVDSGSTDRTREIALSFGASFVSKEWQGYARQKNWALDNLPFESPWVLILDADESVTAGLKDEVLNITSRPAQNVPCTGYYINRVTIFMGREIWHSAFFPSWNLRLFKRGLAHYEEREVHEHMIVHGRTTYLKNLIRHEDRRGLEHFIAKHNRYSTLEAREIFRQRQHWPGWKDFWNDRVARRRYVKYRLAPKLPVPWMLRFVYMYFIRGGILDRRPGLTLCLMISTYELFIRAKYNELVRTEGRDPIGVVGLALREGTAELPLAALSTLIPEPEFLKGIEAAAAERAGPLIESSPIGRTPPSGVGVPTISTPAPPRTPLVPVTPAPPKLAIGPEVATAEPLGNRARIQPSPWRKMENLKRALWMFTRIVLFRPSFHNWYGWRRMVLVWFGAKLGKRVRIRPTAMVEIPWNLDIGDDVIIGDYAILYSLGTITIRRGAIISQYAHLCAGTHDYTTRHFPLIKPPIVVGEEAWIAADAFIGPGVTIGDRAVVGARATVVKDVPADQVVIGPAATFLKPRQLRD